MTSSRPFTADSNKFAYAQAFSRTAAGHPHPHGQRPSSLRGIGALLHRPSKPTR